MPLPYAYLLCTLYADHTSRAYDQAINTTMLDALQAEPSGPNGHHKTLAVTI